MEKEKWKMLIMGLLLSDIITESNRWDEPSISPDYITFLLFRFGPLWEYR